MLNEMLDDFTSTITSNIATFSVGAMGLVGVLALIDYGLDVMGHAGENPMAIIKMSVRKILKYTFYVFLIRDFPNLLKILLNFFVGIGEELGGATIGNKPDAVIDTGFEFLAPIAESIKEISSFKDMGLIAPNLLYICLWIIGFALIGYIVVQIFMTTIEFYLLGGLSVIFLPFGVYSGTDSLVQNTIKVLIGVGTRLTVTITLASLGISRIKSTAITINQTPGELIPFEDIGKFLVFLAIIAYSIWNAPKLISTLLQGGSGAFKATGQGGVADTAKGMAGAVAGTAGAIKETAGGIADGIGKIGETASNIMSKFSSTNETSSNELTESSDSSYFTTSGLGEAAGGMIGGIAGEAYAGEEGRALGEAVGKEIGSKLENNEDSKNASDSHFGSSGFKNNENSGDNSSYSKESEDGPGNYNSSQDNSQSTFFDDNSGIQSSSNSDNTSDFSGGTNNSVSESVSGNESDSNTNKYFDTESGKEAWDYYESGKDSWED